MSLTFHMTVGIPASGKTRWVNDHLVAHPNCAVVSPDLLREHVTGSVSDQSSNHYIFSALVPQAIRANALMRRDIVYDATCYNRKNRRDIIALAKENGYRVIAHVFRTPFDECVRRNQARDRVVPAQVLERMRDGWQEPELTEGFDAIVEIGLDSATQVSETTTI